MIKVLCTCGARPNFMKIAPVYDGLRQDGRFEPVLVHTGQHYDEKMSSLFFTELGIPAPDLNLEVGSGAHGAQTAEVMKRFEPVCERIQPDWVIVVGDVNSTLACALVAAKMGIRVAHVEAGLRSFDRTMPEEINRLLTDAISDLLFVTEPSGVENLTREGIAKDKIRLVGNVMIDTLLRHRARAASSRILEQLDLQGKAYAAVTLHRPSNVDRAENLGPILEALAAIADEIPVVFPMHPRTKARLEEFGFAKRFERVPNLRIVDPLGYLDFLKIMADAAVVLTDSGGIQEETTILGVPCLTLRANTERPITVTMGTNRLVRSDRESILSAYRAVRERPPMGQIPRSGMEKPP